MRPEVPTPGAPTLSLGVMEWNPDSLLYPRPTQSVSPGTGPGNLCFSAGSPGDVTGTLVGSHTHENAKKGSHERPVPRKNLLSFTRNLQSQAGGVWSRSKEGGQLE